MQTLKECKYVDVVVKGEGEETIKELIETVEKEKPLEDARGITFRKADRIVDNPARLFIRNIDEIPFRAGIYSQWTDTMPTELGMQP